MKIVLSCFYQIKESEWVLIYEGYNFVSDARQLKKCYDPFNDQLARRYSQIKKTDDGNEAEERAIKQK